MTEEPTIPPRRSDPIPAPMPAQAAETPTAGDLERQLAHPRVLVRRAGPLNAQGRCVLYWMQRAQRAADNPALNLAIEIANHLGKPVAVFFGLTPHDPDATLRQSQFLLEGLAETQADLARRGTPLLLRLVSPEVGAVVAAEQLAAAAVVTDEDPARMGQQWRQAAAATLTVPFYSVDADVICPTRLFDKEEYAARTLRPKVHRIWESHLKPPGQVAVRVRWPGDRLPDLAVGPHAPPPVTRPLEALADVTIDRSVGAVSGYHPGGPTRARHNLDRFVAQRLAGYDQQRNWPHVAGTSELSAYLRFGQISIHTVAAAALEAKQAPGASAAVTAAADAFLEELIVRRELAINYVVHNPRYDQLEGCPDWARKTLAEHAGDPRPVTYSGDRLAAADTHDPLWNAAQTEMNKTGRMHGYLRMYWAKKILEWSRSPHEAFETARNLNDRLLLDGRDPNGWTGVAWAIGGKHDRPWAPKRPIFGLIRYMSLASTGRKFDSKAYMRRVEIL